MVVEGDRNVVWEYGWYRSTGGPMRFRLISPVGRAPHGWVVIDYRGSSNWGPLRFLLRVELLDGRVLDILLPPSDGEGVSALVRLPARIGALVLEPTNAPLTCTIQRFAVHEISRREALARVGRGHLRRILREPHTIPALTRHAFALWRLEGLSGLGRGLRGASGVSSPTVASPSSAPVAARPDRPSPQPPPAAALVFRPLVSVIMAVKQGDPECVRRAVGSVERQTYTNWELCIGAVSTNPSTLQAVESLAVGNRRLKVSPGSHKGISVATNEALHMARGDYVAFLDDGDVLAADALFQLVAALNDKPDLDVLYSDEDTVDADGRTSEPVFKPDWSAELLRGVMYVGRLLMVRRSLLEVVGGLDSAYDGVQDFEVVLRLSERTERIHHVRAILYHRRHLPGSIAAAAHAEPGVAERQVAAVNAHLQRTGVLAIAKSHPSLPRRVILQPAPRKTSWPMVSVVIASRGAAAPLGPCLDSLFSITTYPRFEAIVVDSASTDSTAKVILRQHPVTLVSLDGPFSVSRAISLGVAQARGVYVVLLNSDIEVLDPEWLQTLVFHLELPNVGIVGPLVLSPGGSVRHAGVTLGLCGTADYVMRGLPADANGDTASLGCTREVMAVTAACLMTTRRHYRDIGGLNEYYRTHYQDVDFCLRTRRMGRRVLHTPRTRLIHHESASRGELDDSLDRALFRDAWGGSIARGDPFHDPRPPGYSE